VFFVRDPTKFQDFIHSQERNAHTGLRSNNAQWDFWSFSPESLSWGAGDQGMMFARFFRKSERIYSSGTHPESRRSVPSNYVGDRSWHRQSVPVVASGGVMDGRGIAAALALGATAVQMGTAFLTCEEAGVSDAYKVAIVRARDNDTRLTRAFSGRPARGIVNRFIREVDPHPDAILPFPLQNALTRPLRMAAAKAGRAEFLSLWAGQGVRMARRQGADDLVTRLAAEAERGDRAPRRLPDYHALSGPCS